MGTERYAELEAQPEIPSEDVLAENLALRARVNALEKTLAGLDRTRAIGLIVVDAVPVVLLLVMGFERRWTSDDAFINFRVVQQILTGHGPVYNTGERVEAYTSPLWIVILTVFAFLCVCQSKS